MEFRLPLEEEREQVEYLWSYCFEPKGDPFFEYYFANCYEPNNIMVAVEDGIVLADLHMRPYTLRVRGKELSTSYIVGVATHPTGRRGGIGGGLLLAALEEERRRGHGISILMPSKAAFYQQYGWDMYCHQWVRRMNLEDLRPITDRSLAVTFITSPDEWVLLAPIYEAYTETLSGYAVRSEADWRRLLGGLFAEGNYVALVKDAEGKGVGYLFYRLGAPEIMVSELVYSTRQGQKALLGYLYNHRSQGTTVRWNEGLQDAGYIFYPNGKEGNEIMPFMMSRIVDVKTAMETITPPPFLPGGIVKGVAYTLQVTDPLAHWNNGVYSVFCSGSTVRVNKLDDTSTLVSDITIDVGGLGLLLMGKLSARELAYEGKLTGKAETIAILQELYPKEQTYINEWY